MKDLMDWIFPRICIHCGERLEPGLVALCTLCRFYGYPLATKTGGLLPEPLACIRPLWVFEKGGSLRRVIHSMKYGQCPQIGLELGECLGAQLLPNLLRDFNVEPERVLLVPVPLYPKKEKKRGYNQAQLLCEGIQQIHPVRIAPVGWVVRTRFTRTQTGLSLEKRHKNVEDAFELRGSLPDLEFVQMILLVDDVYTTGATMFSLMSTLRDGLGESTQSRCSFAGIALASGGS